MCFDNSAYYGFSKVEPWIKCYKDGYDHNVKVELANKCSVLNFVKDLIRLRKANIDSFVYSDVRFIKTDGDYFVYERDGFIVEMNLSEKTLNRYIEKSVVLSNYSVGDNLLKPYQCNVYKA